ncbi:MAG: DUF116 domain-containing protein [bacterium]|nr:DUF116 domain-containing protein [bacterium]
MSGGPPPPVFGLPAACAAAVAAAAAAGYALGWRGWGGVVLLAVAAAAGAAALLLLIERAGARRGRDLLPFIPPAARRAFLMAFHPICRLARRAIGRSGERVDAAFIAAANRYAVLARPGRGGRDVLVLLPRCLQRSDCAANLLESVDECARCGRCDCALLIEIAAAYGCRTVMVAGGRLAQAVVEETSPAAVVAVACEKELMEGLREVGGVPVIGVVNLRPEGPCRNTRVDIAAFRAALADLALPADDRPGAGVS